jgi:hypothetical protein
MAMDNLKKELCFFINKQRQSILVYFDIHNLIEVEVSLENIEL